MLTEATARPPQNTSAPGNCPGCGSTRAAARLNRCRDRLLGVPGEWDVVSCQSCGLTYTFPRVHESELLQFYPSNYHVYQRDAPIRASVLGGLLRRLAMAPYTIRFGSPDWTVEPFGNHRFLDVGCGAGELLKRIGQAGWQCTGIDISPTAVAAARRAMPSAAIEAATLTTFTPEAPFALISMQHVLEHLPEPQESLMRCRSLLQPGGLLIASVPNIASFEAKVFGRRWIGLDIPRHLTHFTPSTLTGLVERSGLEVVRLRPAMFASSLSESLALALPLGLGRKLLGSKLGRLLYLASVFPASVSHLLGNTPVLEILCRRKER